MDKKRPIASGHCGKCDSDFFIYELIEIQVWMHPKPFPPESVVVCPNCGRLLISGCSYRAAWEFKNMGVDVFHSYDKDNDVQPFTEEDVQEFELLLSNDEIIRRLLLDDGPHEES
jgi:hypothetical protein